MSLSPALVSAGRYIKQGPVLRPNNPRKATRGSKPPGVQQEMEPGGVYGTLVSSEQAEFRNTGLILTPMHKSAAS